MVKRFGLLIVAAFVAMYALLTVPAFAGSAYLVATEATGQPPPHLFIETAIAAQIAIDLITADSGPGLAQDSKLRDLTGAQHVANRASLAKGASRIRGVGWCCSIRQFS